MVHFSKFIQSPGKTTNLSNNGSDTYLYGIVHILRAKVAPNLHWVSTLPRLPKITLIIVIFDLKSQQWRTKWHAHVTDRIVNYTYIKLENNTM